MGTDKKRFQIFFQYFFPLPFPFVPLRSLFFPFFSFHFFSFSFHFLFSIFLKCLSVAFSSCLVQSVVQPDLLVLVALFSLSYHYHSFLILIIKKKQIKRHLFGRTQQNYILLVYNHLSHYLLVGKFTCLFIINLEGRRTS